MQLKHRMKRNRKATHIQWDVDDLEDTDDYALNYLKKLVAEKLTGAFTIVGLTKKMDALRKASHLL